MICKYFLSVCSLSFFFLSVLYRAKMFNLDKVQLRICPSSVVLLVSYLRSLPNLSSQRSFSYIFFMASRFTFRSVWSILSAVRSLAYGFPVVLFVEKTDEHPLNCLCAFVKNQLSMLWVFWTLSCCMFVCLCLPVSHCLQYGTW